MPQLCAGLVVGVHVVPVGEDHGPAVAPAPGGLGPLQPEPGDVIPVRVGEGDGEVLLHDVHHGEQVHALPLTPARLLSLLEALLIVEVEVAGVAQSHETLGLIKIRIIIIIIIYIHIKSNTQNTNKHNI